MPRDYDVDREGRGRNMILPCPDPLVYPALTRTDLVRYAGASGDFNPLHHDHEAATRAGLSDVMAQGMLSAGLLASALTKWFGAGSVASYSVRFRSPVWPSDVLSAHCRRLEALLAEDGTRMARAELELVRSSREIVLLGTACVWTDAVTANP
ncbi:acyl dehydratase [Mesorhizobium soli]|uniref:MaoC/PaaZ C-terminal domain-containing protein n=1 Tax=Pseudaminobacter soli (ex Li et al. 2025) TaxID=1295366 RepID=UPI002473C87A|nr:MaoC/PaaZ C-terminal domain-containing protein [Mesorhizobium soli]MDH6235013.1 acyl dehydratase [Mesorhizobium soli]